MVEDTELDKFINDELKKDIDQSDNIDPSVDANINEMGYLWNRTHEKFKADNICFKCKKKIKTKKNEKVDKKAHAIEAKKVEPGVIAFVCLCESCWDKMIQNSTKTKTLK